VKADDNAWGACATLLISLLQHYFQVYDAKVQSKRQKKGKDEVIVLQDMQCFGPKPVPRFGLITSYLNGTQKIKYSG
jgi:hypothetical protein